MKFRHTKIITLIATILVVGGIVLVPHGEVRAQIAGVETPLSTGAILAQSASSTIANAGVKMQKDQADALQGADMWSAVAAFLVNNILLPIADSFLVIMGVLLNGVMILTLNMSSLVNATGVVDSAWSVIRDISSILIIFFLLYSSIEIIIGVGNSKVQHIIVMVVIAGILINFSLFFTKIAVDASNLVSLAFYRAMSPSGANYDFSAKAGSTSYLTNAFTTGGISNEIMQGLAIQTIYMQASSTSAGQFSTSPLVIIAAGLGGFIIMIIAALSFLAAAVLFAIRIGMLIVLMVFSPFYFLGMIMPELKQKISTPWKNHLLHQCFIMPIYMLFMYVALRVITNPSFTGFMNPAQSGSIASVGNANNLAGLVTTGTIGLVMQYIIGIILVTIPLMAAMEYASFGKDWANKATGRVKSWFGEATGTAVGSVAGRVISSKMMDNLHSSNPHVARFVHGQLSNVASSYNKSTAEKAKKNKAVFEHIGKVNRADFAQTPEGQEDFERAKDEKAMNQARYLANLRKRSILSTITGNTQQHLASSYGMAFGKEGKNLSESLKRQRGAILKDMSLSPDLKEYLENEKAESLPAGLDVEISNFDKKSSDRLKQIEEINDHLKNLASKSDADKEKDRIREVAREEAEEALANQKGGGGGGSTPPKSRP